MADAGAVERPRAEPKAPTMIDVNPLAHRFYLKEIERLAGAGRAVRPGALALVACLALAAGPGLLAWAISGG
jgi:hypothetical protein